MVSTKAGELGSLKGGEILLCPPPRHTHIYRIFFQKGSIDISIIETIGEGLSIFPSFGIVC